MAGCGGGGGSGGVNDTPLPFPTPAIQRIAVFAGSLTEAGQINGNGANARFSEPAGLAIDRSGNLYLADSNNNLLRKITAAGVVTTVAGGGDNEDLKETDPGKALVRRPVGVAVDANGSAYFSTGRNVRRLTPQGVLSNVLTLPALSGDGRSVAKADATGLAVDGAGNLYAANNLGTHKMTPAGATSVLEGVATATLYGTGQSSARGLAAGADGTLYALTIDGTISKLTSGGAILVAGHGGVYGSTDGAGAGATFGGAGYIALDSKGNVYHTDKGDHLIRKVTPAGVVSTVAGTRGATTVNIDALPGVLPSINGIAIDAADVLYVVAGNAILKIQLP